MSVAVAVENLAFLNLTQACKLVHLGKPTLRAAIDAGELATAPCRTKSIRIARAELERWAASKVASTFPPSGGAVGPLTPRAPTAAASGDHSQTVDGAP